MKKVIIALSLLAMLIGAGIFETVVMSELYSELHDKMHIARTAILDSNEEKLQTTTDQIMEYWEGKKEVVYNLTNHQTVSHLDEVLVAFKTYVQLKNYDEALVNLEMSMDYVHTLITDTHITLGNLL